MSKFFSSETSSQIVSQIIQANHADQIVFSVFEVLRILFARLATFIALTALFHFFTALAEVSAARAGSQTKGTIIAISAASQSVHHFKLSQAASEFHLENSFQAFFRSIQVQTTGKNQPTVSAVEASQSTDE